MRSLDDMMCESQKEWEPGTYPLDRWDDLSRRAMDILARDPDQNALMVSCLNRGTARNVSIIGQSVCFQDSNSGNYMLRCDSLEEFEAQYAAMPPCTFLLANGALGGRVQEAHPELTLCEYCQWVLTEPPEIEVHEMEGVAFGPVTKAQLPFIFRTYLSDEFDHDYVRRQIERAPALCAFENGKILGYVLTHADGEAGPMYIDPAARGKGLGTEMLRRITRMLVAQGYIPLGHIHTDNQVSMKMHRHVGFHQCGELIFWAYHKSIEKGM